jgi:hypothetical protein
MTDYTPSVEFDWDSIDPEVEPIEPDLPRAALDYLIHRVLIDIVLAPKGRIRSSHAASVHLLAWLLVVSPRSVLSAVGCRSYSRLATAMRISPRVVKKAMHRLRRRIAQARGKAQE